MFNYVLITILCQFIYIKKVNNFIIGLITLMEYIKIFIFIFVIYYKFSSIKFNFYVLDDYFMIICFIIIVVYQNIINLFDFIYLM